MEGRVKTTRDKKNKAESFESTQTNNKYSLLTIIVT